MGRHEDSQRALVSYLTLRQVVGILGILLPVVLAGYSVLFVPGAALEKSISDYYGTPMRDVFVGILFVVGWFLFTYRGYSRADNLVGDFACFSALGVALVPSTMASTSAWHLVFAAGLFAALIVFSLVLFRKTRKGVAPSPGKVRRNRVYLTCGWVMIVCVALIVVSKNVLDEATEAAIKPVFWLESVALLAFGVSWFVKGRTWDALIRTVLRREPD